MTKSNLTQLSRRERQIMDALFQQGEATVAEVRDQLPDPPSYSAVRAQLGILEDKGFVSHEQRGRAYVYAPAVNRKQVSDRALTHLVNTFFDGSVEAVVGALVDMKSAQLSDETYNRLLTLIREKRKQDKG